MWLLKDEKSQIKRFPQEEEGVKISYKCQQFKKYENSLLKKQKSKIWHWKIYWRLQLHSTHKKIQRKHDKPLWNGKHVIIGDSGTLTRKKCGYWHSCQKLDENIFYEDWTDIDVMLTIFTNLFNLKIALKTSGTR